jgi:hypothetical protein
MEGGRADRRRLARGAEGRALCRWCGLEVPAGRRTFCSEWCVNEWRLRTDPGYLREQVYRRDRGVCACCGVDTDAEWRSIRRLPPHRRRAALAAWGGHPGRRSLWDADHIVPVAEGGGECDLENMRTLCLRCHREATAALRRRRKSESPEANVLPAPGSLVCSC